MLSAIPDPFNAYSSAAGSSSSSVNGLDGSGEIFSILQNSTLLGQTGPTGASRIPEDHEILTPAGLLSPRAPATGLSRGRTAPSASSQNQRDSFVSSANSLASPRLNATTNADGTGPGGEISFAALGLTSASHPQAFATPSGIGSAGSIGSPLFGSEDGSQQGDAADTSERKTAGEDDLGRFDPEHRGHEASASDITAIPPSISSSSTIAQDPKTPTRKPPKKKKGKAKSTATTAMDAAEPTASSTATNAPAARPVSASSASIGLSQRLKKALSIIDDRPEGESRTENEEPREPCSRETASDPQAEYAAK